MYLVIEKARLDYDDYIEDLMGTELNLTGRGYVDKEKGGLPGNEIMPLQVKGNQNYHKVKVNQLLFVACEQSPP